AVFLHRPAAQVYDAAHQASELGASYLRLTASWSAIAPEIGSRTVPGAPFDASSSATYPHGSWSALDTAVKAAAQNGLKVMIDLGFWAPRWAVQRPSANPLRQ